MGDLLEFWPGVTFLHKGIVPMRRKWFSLVLLVVWVVGGAWMGCGGSSGPAKVTPEEEKQLQKQLEEAAAAEGRAGWGDQPAPTPPSPKK